MINLLIGWLIISSVAVLILSRMVYTQNRELQRLYIEESRRKPSKEVQELIDHLNKYTNRGVQ